MAHADCGYIALNARNVTGAEKFDHIIIDDRDRKVSGPGHWLMYHCVRDARGRWDTVMSVGRRLTRGAAVLGRVVGGTRDLVGDMCWLIVLII